jgi:hypothetical protein
MNPVHIFLPYFPSKGFPISKLKPESGEVRKMKNNCSNGDGSDL